MKHSKKSKTSLLVVGLFMLATLLMFVPSYQLLVKPRGQAFDLFWIWAGGRAILTGSNPYGPETTRVIQLGVFREIIPPDQYQHGFPHPAHIAFVLLPFIILPFFWSVLLWTSVQIPLFAVTLLVGLRLLDWSLRPLMLLPLTLLSLLGFRYPMIVYVLGQLVFFVLFCFLFALWLFQHNRPRWSAIVLACATIRPDLSLLAFLLAYVLIKNSPRRNEFIITLLGIGLVFLFLPTIFIGFWPFTWINAIRSYGSNPFATWPPELLPTLWLRIVWLIGVTIWASRSVIISWREPTRFNQSFMISAVTLLGLIILPQTGSYTLSFALIPAFILMRYARPRWLQVVIVLSLLTPWLYFMLGDPFNGWIFLLIPLQFILLQEGVKYFHNQDIQSEHTKSPSFL